MKRLSALLLVLGLVLVVSGCPAAPESKDPVLDPAPTPADVPADTNDSQAAEEPESPVPAAEGEKELPPLPKSSAKEASPEPVLLPPEKVDAAAEKPADVPAEAPAEKPAE